MTPAEIRAALAEMNPDALTFDGLDAALVGFGAAATGAVVAVYDYDAIIDALTADGASEEDAVEHFAFNIESAYVGPNTPFILHRLCSPAEE